MRIPFRRVSAIVPWFVGGLVFAFRLLSFRDLTNDHYMHLAWAQQVLFGLLPGRDFVDPGMPLAWGASALAQAIAPGPLPEAVLSAAMLGVAAATTCWVVARLTRSHVAGTVAALTAAALVPRLYNYPKLLVPALTMYLLQRYVEDRSSVKRIALGAGLAAAVLFRHDLGLYAIVVTTTAIAVTYRHSPGKAVREVVLVGCFVALAVSPYLIYVWWSEGLFEHLRRGIEFAKGESHQLGYDWPVFPAIHEGRPSWSREDSTAFLYYFAWILPIAGLLGLKGTARADEQDRLPLAVASLAFLGLYLPIIVRHPLDQRLPDIATPLVVVGAFVGHTLIGAAGRTTRNALLVPAVRVLAGTGGAVVAGITIVAVLNAAYLGQFTRELEETRIERGPRGILSKIRSVREDTRNWPWAKVWPNSGDFPSAVLYLHTCTSPADYVLMTWASPEYYFFAQRRFAAGHSMFLPPDAFTTDRDQEFMLARLEKERPPIALVNKTLSEAFRRAYPMVDTYVEEHYAEAASYRHYDDAEIAIEIRNDLRATSAFGSERWPCGLVINEARARDLP